MALFGIGKNDSEEYEDEDELLEEGGGGRKVERKLKDLRPENRKRRKEPPKPWGKKERIIVLVTLALTVIVSAILAFDSSWGGEFHLSFPKINFRSLNIFKEETIIVGKK